MKSVIYRNLTMKIIYVFYMLTNKCFIAGHYAYTKADEGSLGDIAELISVGIRSSPYQCLSFWYHMHGRNIGLLRVYQIYLNHDWNMPIWNVTGAA